MAPKRSAIWNYFSFISNAEAKCNFCVARISTKSGSTGNLRRHIKLKHASIPLTDGPALERMPRGDDDDDVVELVEDDVVDDVERAASGKT